MSPVACGEGGEGWGGPGHLAWRASKSWSQIVRYVHISDDIKEVFLGYFQVSGKDAQSLANAILRELEENKIPIQNCRGQSYDNAAVMAGHRGGVQQKIMEINNKAEFVNCENHSLNLACVLASETDPVVITFFGTIERVFTFFHHPLYDGKQWNHIFLEASKDNVKPTGVLDMTPWMWYTRSLMI